MSLEEVEIRWSVDDLVVAHQVLDLYDELEDKAQRSAKSSKMR